MSSTRYLIPIIEWATNTSIYARTKGRNFVICFALDKGRVDYPFANVLVRDWHAITTVGDEKWLREKQPFLGRFGSPSDLDPCENRTTLNSRPFEFHAQDIVIPVPTSYAWNDRATNTNRPLLLFYAASPNSCTRALIDSVFEGRSRFLPLSTGLAIENGCARNFNKKH